MCCVAIVPDGNVPDGNLALMKTQPRATHAFFTFLSCINIFHTLLPDFPKWLWGLNEQCFSLQTVSAGFFMSYHLNGEWFFSSCDTK